MTGEGGQDDKEAKSRRALLNERVSGQRRATALLAASRCLHCGLFLEGSVEETHRLSLGRSSKGEASSSPLSVLSPPRRQRGEQHFRGRPRGCRLDPCRRRRLGLRRILILGRA